MDTDTKAYADTKAYRLPRHVVPGRYDVKLRARLGSDQFEGSVSIRLDVVEPRDSIEIHARDLHLSDARLACGGRDLEAQVELDPEREIAVLRFAEPLAVGAASLYLSFRGQVNKGLKGLYLAQDGPEELLCTQCFATDARSVFPCFDEPDLKAQFSYQITTRADHTVLTNSPCTSVWEVGQKDGAADGSSAEEQAAQSAPEKIWRFAPTEPMSTYLVALAIGDIEGTPEERVNGTPVRVWAIRGKGEMGQFAHRFTSGLLPWYEEYFGAPYHWGKYDQIAVPGFAAGAMENSGLVTFRQQLLLMKPQTASWQGEKRIALVVAHEFAHQWFGNLATVKWWDDVWLSEAFAEWLGHKAVDALAPDYSIWYDFQAGKAAALRTDALDSTHSIYKPVQTADQAIEMFDVITYQKGCAVLRMVERFLGEGPFRAGLQSYIRDFAEANATGADLWHHLQGASDQPVAEIMEKWITQPGHPVISVSLDSSDGQRRLRLSQERCYATPSAQAKASEGDAPTWPVPVVVRHEDDSGIHDARYLFSDRETTVPLEAQGDVKWCYPNADDIGFYRLRLESGLLDALLANLDKLTPAEQIGLLDDQWAAVSNATQSMSRYLDVLAAVARVEHYSVIERVVAHIDTLERLVQDSGDEEAVRGFRSWVASAFGERQQRLGFDPREGESRNDSQSRARVIEAMTRLAQAEEPLREAEGRAEREMSDPAAVSADLASIFISAAAQTGDRGRFDHYVETYKARRAAGSSPEETNRYLNSIVQFRPPELVDQTLSLMQEGVLPQESHKLLLGAMLGRRHSQRAAWEYMKAHWESLRARSPLVAPYLVRVAGQLPASMRDDIVAFFDANLHGEAQQAYARALETLDQQAELQARTQGDLVSWLKEKSAQPVVAEPRAEASSEASAEAGAGADGGSDVGAEAGASTEKPKKARAKAEGPKSGS